MRACRSVARATITASVVRARVQLASNPGGRSTHIYIGRKARRKIEAQEEAAGAGPRRWNCRPSVSFISLIFHAPAPVTFPTGDIRRAGLCFSLQAFFLRSRFSPSTRSYIYSGGLAAKMIKPSYVYLLMLGVRNLCMRRAALPRLFRIAAGKTGPVGYGRMVVFSAGFRR